MKKYIVVFSLFLALAILPGCTQNVDSHSSDTLPPGNKDSQKIVIGSSEYTGDEINAMFMESLNSVLYYSFDMESEYFTYNPALILNKNVDYSLYYVCRTNTFGIRNNVIKIIIDTPYPMHKTDLGDLDGYVYDIEFPISEQGLGRTICYMYGVPADSDVTKDCEDEIIFIGDFSFNISEITLPEYNKKSADWISNATEAVKKYITDSKDTDFDPTAYEIYIKNFTEADQSTLIYFIGENGSMYLGNFNFVNSVPANSIASISNVQKIELDESNKESYMSYVKKIKDSAALNFSYTITKDTQSSPVVNPSPNPNGKLIVNGNDISSKCYFKIYKSEQYAEIPVTAVLEELGAKVEWNDNIVTITYNDIVLSYNTSDGDYGYYAPPGADNITRKIVNGDMIFEDDSARVLIKALFGLLTTVDYENMIIEIS